MFGCKCFQCKCFQWSRLSEFVYEELDTFSLPATLPQWPQGEGFASGTVNLGELQVFQITKFQLIWECKVAQDRKKRVGFYKPIGVPDGYFKLGYYCQSTDKPLHGFVLVARQYEPTKTDICSSPALAEPLDYNLIWSSDDGSDSVLDGCGFVWLPQSPEGYKALGYLVTNKPGKPDLDEVRCVRADLTDQCEAHRCVLNYNSNPSQLPLKVWSTRPRHRGMHGKGVATGTFFCTSYLRNREEDMHIVCLKNLNTFLHAMPNLDQIHALISHYGPTVFFHPDENYLPSSVSWFFDNGAMIFKKDEPSGENVDAGGSNLPAGGSNDRQYWIDLPSDKKQRKTVIRGNLETAKLYVHVKPAFGGTFTDIVFWVFCPFNGPGMLKIGLMNFALSKVGQHVCDWEHFTLRISNFTGELWCVYFSQHSGGEWVDVTDLEYIEGNKPIIYSSRNGHASYPHPGTYLQGSRKLGIGVRNDAAKSNNHVDASLQYEVVAAEYLGEGVVIEPNWLQYMREWGPKIVYDSRTELDRIMNALPDRVRNSVQNVVSKLPVELCGEEGPTGPKEKNNWFGDERW